MDGEVAFKLRARNENAPVWQEFLDICKDRDIPYNAVFNSVMPAILQAMKDIKNDKIITIHTQIKIQ